MKQQNENSLILEYKQVPANLKDTFLENCSKEEIEIISKYEQDL